MKKILAVSLGAIMAVSAARADIASVEYVEKQTGVLTNLTTTAKGNLVGAINEVAGKANAAATQAAFDDLKSTVDGLTTGDNSVGDQIDDKISGLDKADTAVAKQFVTAVSEESGIVSVSRRALEAADIPTIEQSQVNGLTTALSGKQATISDLATIRSGAAAGATALQPAAISDMQTKTNMKNAITTGMDQENTYPTVALVGTMIDSSAQEINLALGDKQATLTGTNVTSTGDGNVVTSVTAANGKVTVTKGTTLGSLATKSTVTSADITDGTIAKADLATAVQTSLGLADSAMQESALKGLASWTSAKCGTTGVTCSLVSKDGKIAWEAVKY